MIKLALIDTEGFDVESNEALRELLHSELKNKTIVFITHKYKELESVDKVYRLSKGILELVRSQRYKFLIELSHYAFDILYQTVG